MAARIARLTGFIKGCQMPKGPFRTKNGTESKFTTAREKRYGNSKTLRRVLRSAFSFLGKRGRKTVRIVKTTAVAKYYGFGRRTIFSTEGSFGWGGFKRGGFPIWTCPSFSGEGKWGRTKYRRIPKCEGDKQGRVPKVPEPQKKIFRTRDLELPFF